MNVKTGETVKTFAYNYEGLVDEYASGENTAYYTYDTAWRKVQAKRNGTVEKYSLNGSDVVADYDGDDSVKATYNTPTLDGNMTKKVGEDVYFYLKDGLGNIRDIVDSAESQQNSYDYKAFGSFFGNPTENISNRFKFNARELESLLGMYDYRSRIYGPGAGRFMKRDAPQFLGIEVNPYRYVNNRPTLFGDPFGFTSCITCGYAYSMSEEHCRVLAGTYKVGGMSYKDCMRTADKGYHYCMSICNGGGDNPWNQKYYDQWKENTEKLNRMRDNCELTAHEYEEMKNNMDRGFSAAIMFSNNPALPWWAGMAAFLGEVGNAYSSGYFEPALAFAGHMLYVGGVWFYETLEAAHNLHRLLQGIFHSIAIGSLFLAPTPYGWLGFALAVSAEAWLFYYSVIVELLRHLTTGEPIEIDWP